MGWRSLSTLGVLAALALGLIEQRERYRKQEDEREPVGVCCDRTGERHEPHV